MCIYIYICDVCREYHQLELEAKAALVIFTMPVLDHPSDAKKRVITVALSRAFFEGFLIGLHPTYQHYILYMCMENIYIPSGYD